MKLRSSMDAPGITPMFSMRLGGNQDAYGCNIVCLEVSLYSSTISYILYQVIQQFVIQSEQQKRCTRLVDIAQLLCAQHASYHLLQLTLLVGPAKSGSPQNFNYFIFWALQSVSVCCVFWILESNARSCEKRSLDNQSYWYAFTIPLVAKGIVEDKEGRQ